MTYDPRQTFAAQQLAFSRAAGTQTSKQQGLRKGLGVPDYSSSAYDTSSQAAVGYDEIKLPSQAKVDKKIKTFGEKPDDRNLDQKIYDGMKYYGAQFFGMNKPEPRDDDMFLLDAYNSDPMFVIPDPVPVTESGINTGGYDFIDMSKLTGGPSQPRTQPNIDTTPQIGGVDEVPTIDRNQVVGKGLGSPTMESQPILIGSPTNTAAYTIQSGDTLGEIADATGTTVQELMYLNKIEDKNRIVAGKDIKIPIYRDDDAEVVKNATSMKELEPIKTAYPLVHALPPHKPKIPLNDAIITRLKTEEGIDYVAEKKFGEEFYTIGHGHYGADVKEGQTITAKEADALLRKDLAKRIPKIKSKIKNFDRLSQELQIEIAQSWFRGGIAGSPITIDLINEGKFQEASEEFLDNNEYRTTTLRGVKRRMKGLSDTLAKEANRI